MLPHGKDLQIVAYLYEVNKRKLGTLVSHGVVTKRNVKPGQSIPIEINMVASSYDFQRDRKMVLVLDASDYLYHSPKESKKGFSLVQTEGSYLKVSLPSNLD